MRLLALLGALTFALAGCGSDGNGGERLTAGELRERADAICAEYERKLDELDEPDSFEDLGSFATEARRAFSDGLDDLRELEPPEDLEEDYDRWLVTGDDALDRIDELLAAVEDRDQETVQELLASADESDDESDRIARGLGLEECSDD